MASTLVALMVSCLRSLIIQNFSSSFSMEYISHIQHRLVWFIFYTDLKAAVASGQMQKLLASSWLPSGDDEANLYLTEAAWQFWGILTLWKLLIISVIRWYSATENPVAIFTLYINENLLFTFHYLKTFLRAGLGTIVELVIIGNEIKVWLIS